MNRIIGVLILFLIFNSSTSSQCFYPPDGYVLYTSDAAVYHTPAITGFVTFSSHESGEWSINSVTNTALGNFLDSTGRSSTIEIRGEGMLTIDNEITDISTLPHTISNCTQKFNLQEYVSNSLDNPDLASLCPLNVVVVLDESGSIADGGISQAIRNGVLSFANILNGTGSTMALVEFDSRASHVMINGSAALQAVDGPFIGGLSSYLTNDYQPAEDALNLVGGTNWEEALRFANSVTGATLILMMTDGNPTFYSVNGAMMGSIAGEGDIFDLTALKEAQEEANNIKSQGKHIFVIGIDIPVNIQPITDISGSIQYNFGDGPEAFRRADCITVSSSQITRAFTEIGMVTCGQIVPTLNEWGIIILTLLFLIVGTLYIQQHSTAEKAFEIRQ